MASPFAPYSVTDGLHILKDKCAEKTHMGAKAAYLAEADHLLEAITATREACQMRADYRLTRNFLEMDAIAESQRERMWEQAVFQRWHFERDNVRPVSDCWDFLLSYQIPLFAQKDKASWGYIDLLGIKQCGHPVVIEFKKEPGVTQGRTVGSETPLRMVIEAAAYAISVQANWHIFKSELHQMQQRRSKALPFQVLDDVPRVHLVGAAPASYWLDWLPVTDKGKSHALSAGTWRAFGMLLKALDEVGLPVSFVSVSGDPANPHKLAAQPLVAFPAWCIQRQR